ncbi:hypothetical protein O1M54_19745 [Streptomyces diastatochromogenes]|nr:hypothetical protein [Streptomyces diastatochromogenes]
MADEHNKWLTRDTAERLLRGESLEAVDASSSDQAERLAKALGALSAEAAPATGELPGEQAALAAFRKVREAAEAERTAAALGDGTPGAPACPRAAPTPAWSASASRPVPESAPAGRAGPARCASRSPRRWPRACSAGSPWPPAAECCRSRSTTTARTPRPPSPPPRARDNRTPRPRRSPPGHPPEHGHARRRHQRVPRPSGGATAPDQGTDPGTTPGSGDASGNPGTWWQVASAACRDLKDGKELGSDRRRALEGLAGGSRG